VRRPGRTFIVGVFAFWIALVANVEAQQPIRIGASLSQTGAFSALGQNRLRGYQLCVKHTNEKGGVLRRKLELVVEDDRTQDRVDAILGPYSSPITEAVADVSEKHRMPMVAPGATATSIFRKERKFVFMVQSPAEVYLEGLIEMAAKRGLKTVAVINEDTFFPKASAQGTVELAKKKGLQVVLAEAYPKGTTDFGPRPSRIRTANPDVLAAAAYFDDAVAINHEGLIAR
jgi:branched-chain amino acid transport system substrate-binding protein